MDEQVTVIMAFIVGYAVGV